MIAHSTLLSRSSVATQSVGDPGSTRVVYLSVAALVLLGVFFGALALWLLRRTRPDLELLSPLEQMDSRSWRRCDPATQLRLLDAARPPGAIPLRRSVLEPVVDAEFEELRPVTSFDDLAPTPAVTAFAVGPTAAELATTDAPADSDLSDIETDPLATLEETDVGTGDEPESETADETVGETADDTERETVEETAGESHGGTDGDHADEDDSATVDEIETSVDGVVEPDDGSVDASSIAGAGLDGQSVADMTTEVARPAAIAHEALTMRAGSDPLATAPNSVAVTGSHSDPAVPQPG